MSQTILIESNSDLYKIYSLNLTTFVGTNVIERKNAEDAIALLKILPQISLVIVQEKVNQEETAIRLYNFLKDTGLETSMIVIGDCPTISTEVLCLHEPVTWETLVRESARLLGVTLQDTVTKPKPDYLPVASFYFYDIQSTPCDVYIRIKKGPNDYQFVKRINQKESFDLAAIQKYEEQGLKEFYIPKDFIQYFTTFVTNQLVQKLERDDLSLEDRILITSHAHDIVRDRVKTLGLDEACVDLADASISSMVKSVRNSPEIANLLKLLFSNKISYAYQHCHLVALMGHYVLQRQSWYKDDHLQILSFASFFSDVTLRSAVQMQINSMKDLREAPITDDERNAVLNHAADAVDILSAHPEITDYIRTVILQSHGSTNGVGFEDNPPEDLHPISKVFIIADAFVKILLNPEKPSKKAEILPLLASRYSNPSYQRIIKSLEVKFDS